MKKRILIVPFATILALSGCVSAPRGPTVMVLPGTQKTFEQFREEDYACRQYAQTLLDPASKAAADNAVSGAVVGTAIGAAAGAIIGSASGQPGSGAAIGAGTGLLVGSAAASDGAYGSYYEMQHSYDVRNG